MLCLARGIVTFSVECINVNLVDEIDKVPEEFGVAGTSILADEGGEVFDCGIDDLGGYLVFVGLKEPLEGIPVVGREDSGKVGGT